MADSPVQLAAASAGAAFFLAQHDAVGTDHQHRHHQHGQGAQRVDFRFRPSRTCEKINCGNVVEPGLTETPSSPNRPATG